MVLCFAAFANILKLCSLPGTSNQKLVFTLVSTIDPNNRYGEKDNDTAISRLMNCKRGFPAVKVDASSGAIRTLDGPQTDIIALAAKLTAADVAANFQPVISLLNEDKKRAAVSALQHLIKSDDSLEMGHRDLFIKCMHNTAARVACLKEVELSSFFAGLFLYTVLTNENAAGPESLEEIKRPGFINRFESSTISLKFESESPESYTVDIPKVHTYLQKLKDKYNNLPTILHKEAFIPFRDYYVPNNVEWHERIPGKGYSIRTLSNVTLENLITLSRFLFLSGTGGLGKSMMMRNLLLTAVDEYDSLGLIPLFIPLKDYSADCPTLSAHIFETVKNLWPELNMELLEQLLSSGKALLLFDGLDEITMRNLPLFTKQLNAFMDRFSTNTFIVSSRPYSNFQSFTRYTVLYLKPLTKEQALSMVDRFNYRADSPKMQSQFRALLNTVLYISHTEFVGNPLLLSIMLLTYEMDAEVPMQKYIFFQEAYAVLSRRHDATKDGYHRELRTGWSANDFAKYFSFFCAVSYSNGKVSFNEADLETYFRMMDDKYHLTPVDVDDFIFDATNNLCLMFQDGLNYGFIHRSFQEYFCARFFHNQLDTDLERVIPIFNRRELNKKDDMALPMLFDMKPQAVEKYLILPYLKSFIRECEDKEGMWTFLEAIYPDYEAADGEAFVDEDNTEPNSNLYAFILEHYNISLAEVLPEQLPGINELRVDYMVYREDIDESDWKENLPFGYEYEYGEPEVVGNLYRFDWDKIKTAPYCANLKAALESEDSPFLKEYNSIKELLARLERNNSKKTISNNIFDGMF